VRRLADPPARGGFPPAVNLRPGGDHPGRALGVVDLPRAAAILDRIAADIDELARARRVDDLAAAAGNATPIPAAPTTVSSGRSPL
jgi:hypothetical protein